MTLVLATADYPAVFSIEIFGVWFQKHRSVAADVMRYRPQFAFGRQLVNVYR